MDIRIGFDITFEAEAPTPMVVMLDAHPSEECRFVESQELRTEPEVPIERYIDSFGNRCGRLMTPAGRLRLWSDGVIRDSGEKDPVPAGVPQVPVEQLPHECLQFLLPSRYCEADLIAEQAWDLFGSTPAGWERIAAVLDWVHSRVRYGYEFAHPTKTAMDVLSERAGVCRDFQHLSIAFCRALNIPARYVSGYLGDIGVPPLPTPMDFHAWFEVYLGDRWYPVDARHNEPRIGRVLMSRGRDAADTALTTSFGSTRLLDFKVWTDEIPALNLTTDDPAADAEEWDWEEAPLAVAGR